MALKNKYNPLLKKGIQKINSAVTLVDGTVDVYANLPDATLNDKKVYFVTDNSGGLLSWLGVYKYPKGLYISDGSTWEQMPLSVKFAEDSTTLVNITNWSDYIGTAIDIYQGDILIFNSIQYQNLTGTQTSTSPDLDLVNWKSLKGIEIGAFEGQLAYWNNTTKEWVAVDAVNSVLYSQNGSDAMLSINNATRTLQLMTNGNLGSEINFSGQLAIKRGTANVINLTTYGAFIEKSLTVKGGNIRAITLVTGLMTPYQALNEDYSLLLENNVTALFPLNPNDGQVLNFKCIEANCIIGVNGSTLDGDTSDFSMIQDEILKVQFKTGLGWFIM